MARTVYFTGNTGSNYYAKPSPLTNPWASDAIAATPGLAGQFSVVIGDGPHVVFNRAGASPASTDLRLCEFGAAIPTASEISLQIASDVENDQNNWDVATLQIAAITANQTWQATSRTITGTTPNAINASSLATDAVTEIQTGLATSVQAQSIITTQTSHTSSLSTIANGIATALTNIGTLLGRITGLIRTKAEDETADAAIKTHTTNAVNSIALGGNGQYAITFQARVGTTAIPNAKISIFQGSTLVDAIYTGSNGNKTYNLDAGNYTINVTANGYSPISGQSVTVSAAANVAIAMTAITIDEPDDPLLCVVRCSVINNSGQPVANARIEARLEDKNPAVPYHLISRAVLSGVTNASGYVDLTLIQKEAFSRGGTYLVDAYDSTGRRINERRINVPSAPTAYLADIPTAVNS